MGEFKVSIITPMYNCSEFIEATYLSIKSQTYQNWEWIVTDDCSDDDSYEKVRRISLNDHRVKLFKNNSNSGAAVSRNNSITMANGRFIAFLDSDDLWEPNKLQVQVDFMLATDSALSYSDYQLMSEDGSLKCKVRETPEYVTYRTLLKENIIGCLTAMYDTEKIGKVYMPLIRKRQDFGLWLNILKIIPRAYKCPGVLSIYRERTASVSSNKIDLLKYNFELFHKHQNMGVSKASYYLTVNVLYKIFKRNKVAA